MVQTYGMERNTVNSKPHTELDPSWEKERKVQEEQSRKLL
jgi:hypothetical protein